MNSEHNKRRRKTAAQLMSELQRDPAYVAKEHADEEKRREAMRKYTESAEPLLAALSRAGFSVSSIRELRQQDRAYQIAIPILLEWLPRISDATVKEDIVRTLSVPWAGPSVVPVLVEEFKRADDTIGAGLRWGIANALEIVAGDSDFDVINDLVRDKRYGKAREMLALSLGNMKREAAVDTLIELLEDDQVFGHAMVALGRLKAQKARQRIEALVQHPTAWVRREAKRALTAIGGANG
jgi:hypothetical protein